MTPDEGYDEPSKPDFTLAKVKHPIIALVSAVVGMGVCTWGFIDLAGTTDPDGAYWWAITRVFVGLIIFLGIGGTLTAAGPRKIYNAQKEEALPERLHE